jgi:Uma2 family endonuclease
MPVVMEMAEAVLPLPHKKWTRDEFLHLEDAGMSWVQQYELLEGELVPKMGKNAPHVFICKLVGRWLEKVFGVFAVAEDWAVALAFADGERSLPEPDFLVLRNEMQPTDSYPTGADLELVVEISDSTLTMDLGVKARLYARSFIPEYWVVDVQGRRVIVHRDSDGAIYRSVVGYAIDEMVNTLARPNDPVLVRNLFERSV